MSHIRSCSVGQFFSSTDGVSLVLAVQQVVIHDQTCILAILVGVDHSRVVE